MDQHYTLDDLTALMARLRDPDLGCPWDLAQDFSTIVAHTLEEAYEVADAIERKDYPHLKDELGDLLFQVVFYAQLGREQNRFDLSAIIDNLVRKLLRRHPHVFPGGTLESSRAPGEVPEQSEINATWERIKAAERAAGPERKPDPSILADIPAALPAMVKSEKVQKRAAAVGFDWTSVDQVFAKLEEESAEIRDALQHGNADAVEDEVGDLFFVCVNLARYLKVNPEKALRRANRKFEQRFRLMEQSLSGQDADFRSQDEAQLDTLWRQAKAKLLEQQSTPGGTDTLGLREDTDKYNP